MACWKVGTEALRGSLLGSVDDCCGIAEEVLIAETAVRVKWRREACGGKRWLELGLPARRRQRREVWGLRNEMTSGNARMAMPASQCNAWIEA